MAFTVSNAKYSADGELNRYIFDWTGSVGDDDGSITLKGGRVYMCHLYNQDSDGDKPTPCNISVDSGAITITVGNRSDVTNGRGYISYL
jgi:hypothetical protein